MVSVVGKGDMGQAPDIGSIVSPTLTLSTTIPIHITITGRGTAKYPIRNASIYAIHARDLRPLADE